MAFFFYHKVYKEDSKEQKRLYGIEHTLDRLYIRRDLEISNLWQRSIFLAVFLTLTLSAYGVLISKIVISESSEKLNFLYANLGCVGLATIGIIFSLIWVMMGKASKAWYEVYEKAIAEYEESYWRELSMPPNKKATDTDYRMGCMDAKEMDNRLYSPKAGAYSPSKLNILIGQIFWLIWITIFFIHGTYLAYKSFELYENNKFDFLIFKTILCSIFFAVLALLLFNLFAKELMKTYSRSGFFNSNLSKIDIWSIRISYLLRKIRLIREHRRRKIIKKIKGSKIDKHAYIKQYINKKAKMVKTGLIYKIPSKEWNKNKDKIKLFHIHTDNKWMNNDELTTNKSSRLFKKPIKILRENDFERYRKENFPNYPSRTNCLFLCTEKDIVHWTDKLSKRSSLKTFEIELIEGDLIFVDEAIYDQENRLSFNESMEDAKLYWEGNKKEKPILTGLFAGKFKVFERN